MNKRKFTPGVVGLEERIALSHTGTTTGPTGIVTVTVYDDMDTPESSTSYDPNTGTEVDWDGMLDETTTTWANGDVELVESNGHSFKTFANGDTREKWDNGNESKYIHADTGNWSYYWGAHTVDDPFEGNITIPAVTITKTNSGGDITTREEGGKYGANGFTEILQRANGGNVTITSSESIWGESGPRTGTYSASDVWVNSNTGAWGYTNLSVPMPGEYLPPVEVGPHGPV